jgi:hypothetical protein
MPLEAQDFLCRICTQPHPISTSYSIKVPAAALAILKGEVDTRVVITSDHCAIEQREGISPEHLKQIAGHILHPRNHRKAITAQLPQQPGKKSQQKP